MNRQDPMMPTPNQPGESAVESEHQVHALAPGAASVTTSRHHATVLIDDEVIAPPAAEKPKRRRGRPPGSTTRVTHAHVTADEFAVLRAVAQGVDIAAAARQYLLWPGRVPERPALLKIYSDLLRRVEAGAQALPENKLARRMVRDLLNHQTVVLDSPASPYPSTGPACAAPAAVPSPTPGHATATTSSDPATLAQTRRVKPTGADSAASAPGSAVAAQSPAATRHSKLPTLEEFAARFDEDMYSEAELLELYEEEYGTLQAVNPASPVRPNVSPTALVQKAMADAPLARQSQVQSPLASFRPPSSAPSGEGAEADQQIESANALAAKSLAARIEIQLKAINWLDERLGTRPVRTHHVDQWVRLNEAQRQAMREAGVIKLGDLVDWISLQGERWVEKVPGYGLARGRNLLQWLKRWEIEPREGLKPVQVADPMPSSSSARSLATVAGVGLVPLMSMDWPLALNGASGKFRRPNENSLAANNDQEAVQAWFRLLRDKSAHTQTSYRRAIERLILWAVHERGLALSSLTELDMQDFKDFLCSPPAHWVQDPKADRWRKASTWRPLKGPLNEMSLNVTFAAVSAMYSHWMESQYTTLNPARKLIGRRSDELTMDVKRSFTDQDMDVIARTFEKLPDTPAKRRLRAILLLLELAGLRREEACNATWGDVQRVRVDGNLTDNMCIEVIGKGNRQRFVPLHEAVLAALKVHLQDRKELMAKGKKLQKFKTIPDKKQPLLGVLDDKWIQVHDRRLDDQAAIEDQVVEEFERPALQDTVNKTGGLSVQLVYLILKEFFKQCSNEAKESVTDDMATFKRASTHWLRHTFAHHLLKETDRDLALVQAVLGHKSITTTAIYVKADLEARVKGVKKLRGSI
ncbi:tyrosine-type recombinase/integrase [Curvibacter gracilis]|uniref:tyrosine-type recombinase/integrase n=1 Tax=Curvibacter gracilis TaxID=230310 RepID=UPI00146FB437|nr:tyrosine-type recombinase/integrase [Curvibacter gracilis]